LFNSSVKWGKYLFVILAALGNWSVGKVVVLSDFRGWRKVICAFFRVINFEETSECFTNTL
jgi:hypothetical protein